MIRLALREYRKNVWGRKVGDSGPNRALKSGDGLSLFLFYSMYGVPFIDMEMAKIGMPMIAYLALKCV